MTGALRRFSRAVALVWGFSRSKTGHVEELVLRAGGGVVVPVCSPSPALLPGPEVSFPSALLRAGLGQVSEAWNSGVCLLTCGSPPVSC